MKKTKIHIKYTTNQSSSMHRDEQSSAVNISFRDSETVS